MTVGKQHPARELRDGSGVLFMHHGGELEVVAEEQFVVLSRTVAASVSPGGFGIGCRTAISERGPSEGSTSVQSTARASVASLCSAGTLASNSSSQKRCSGCL